MSTQIIVATVVLGAIIIVAIDAMATGGSNTWCRIVSLVSLVSSHGGGSLSIKIKGKELVELALQTPGYTTPTPAGSAATGGTTPLPVLPPVTPVPALTAPIPRPDVRRVGAAVHVHMPLNAGSNGYGLMYQSPGGVQAVVQNMAGAGSMFDLGSVVTLPATNAGRATFWFTPDGVTLGPPAILDF